MRVSVLMGPPRLSGVVVLTAGSPPARSPNKKAPLDFHHAGPDVDRFDVRREQVATFIPSQEGTHPWHDLHTELRGEISPWGGRPDR